MIVRITRFDYEFRARVRAIGMYTDITYDTP